MRENGRVQVLEQSGSNTSMDASYIPDAGVQRSWEGLGSTYRIQTNEWPRKRHKEIKNAFKYF
jgi:hypothetical protein